MSHATQSHAKNLGHDLDELIRVSAILRDDTLSIMQAFDTDWTSQTMRRTLVRAAWAYIEGIVFTLKQFILRASDLGDMVVSASERAFLSESVIVVDSGGTARQERRWTTPIKNVKRTLQLASTRFALDWAPDFGSNGWSDLQEQIGVRHRVTHPKSSSTLAISDPEIDQLRNALCWFIEQFNALQVSLLRRYEKS